MLRSRVLPLLLGALVAAPSACNDGPRDPASASGSGGASVTSGSSSGSAGPGSGGAGGGEASVAWCNRGPRMQICNPFGAALESSTLQGNAYWDLLTDTFKVHFYRPATLYLDQFAKNPAACVACDEAASRGLYLVLVVRNDGGPSTPTNPPLDLDAYKAALGQVIERYKHALAVVVIEDEINAPSSYAGSVADYLAELEAGCEVAHVKHVRCADGGLGSTSLLYLLADLYRGVGFTQEPIRILQAAKTNPSVPQVFKDGQATDADTAALLLSHQVEIDEAKRFVLGFRDAGVNYVNFHWYEESVDTFDEAVAYLRSASGCRAVITDELGQRAHDEGDAAGKLGDAKELGLPFVIWSSPGMNGSVSLVDSQGKLTPSGAALQELSTTAICDD